MPTVRMLIWPFIFITVALTAVLGYAISQIERKKVMNNWTAYRCSPAVMFTAGMFKPPNDPRSSSTFAGDNFQYCMNDLAETIMSSVLEPLTKVFSGQGYLAQMIGDSVNVIRQILATVYNDFLGFMNDFFRRYSFVSQQLLNTTAHLRAAFQRVNATVLSTVFIGLSLFRGILNSVDFVIKIVLVILGIMVALMIVLFFVLFPFFPLIFSVIGVIVAFAVGSVAAEASNLRGGFCVPGDTMIVVEGGRQVPISSIEPSPDGPITSVMKFSGKGVQMYLIDGVKVSGAHIILQENGEGWHHVRNDPRARPIPDEYEYIYCLNTRSHTIEIVGDSGKSIFLRDWEEIEDGDIKTSIQWSLQVLKYLNRSKSNDMTNKWLHTVHYDNSEALLAAECCVLLPNEGQKAVSEVQIGDFILSEDGRTPTEVLGIIKGYGIFTEEKRTQNIFKKHENGYWFRENYRVAGLGRGNYRKEIGYNFITSTGTYRTNIGTVRDFSEVGMDYLAEFNKIVEETLAG